MSTFAPERQVEAVMSTLELESDQAALRLGEAALGAFGFGTEGTDFLPEELVAALQAETPESKFNSSIK